MPNKRPLGISILAWIMIVLAVSDLVAAVFSIWQANTLPEKEQPLVMGQYVAVIFVLSLRLIVGVSLLGLRPWARWVAMIVILEWAFIEARTAAVGFEEGFTGSSEPGTEALLFGFGLLGSFALGWVLYLFKKNVREAFASSSVSQGHSSTELDPNIIFKIKWMTILMGVSNAINFVYLDFRQPLGLQLFILVPLILGIYVLLYFFYQGRNWARVWILIGAAVGLLSFFSWQQYHFFQRIVLILQGFLGVYILYALNTKAAKQFFKTKSSERALSKAGKRNSLKTVLIVVAFVGVVLGCLAFFIFSFLNKVQSMSLWYEEVESGKAGVLIGDGLIRDPQFLSSGRKIVFSYNSPDPDRKGAEIQVYSLANGNRQTLISDGAENLSPVLGVGDQSLFYVSITGGQGDVWVFSLKEGAKKQLTNDVGLESDLALSPDGKWLAFTQSDAKGGSEIYLISTEGGEKKRLTYAKNFLELPNSPVWMPDSKRIAYLGFAAINIIDLEGRLSGEIDLSGLNNFKDLMLHPLDEDKFIFAARPAQSMSFKFNLYQLSRTTQELQVWKSSRDLIETFYDLSPDGKSLIYTKPSEEKIFLS